MNFFHFFPWNFTSDVPTSAGGISTSRYPRIAPSGMQFLKISQVNHNGRMNSIDFGVHMSKVKVKMGIIDKCGVREDATLCVVIFCFKSGQQCCYDE